MNGIGFKNMKVFKEEQWFDFKNISLLTGTNNSGKSSIINAMQMLQENIKATNIDDLIKTEFKLTSNQNKYGSIASFVNNEANLEENFFSFVRQINNVEYNIKIDINSSGLQSFGRIKSINATDINTKEIIFTHIVDQPYPNYKCNFNINYKYFIDRFNKKCENTEKLRQRIVELDHFKNEVEEGIKTFDQFKEFALEISKELSVYISAYTVEVEGNLICIYTITNHHGSIDFDQINIEKINEFGLFFNEPTSNADRTTNTISEEEYSKLFETSYNLGLFDFSFLWKDNPEIETEFKNIICSFYKKSFVESYKMLCDDLITMISNNNWEMEIDDAYLNSWLLKKNLTEAFFESLPDFGLVGSIINLKDKKELDGVKNKVNNYFIRAKQTWNLKAESMAFLQNTNFIDEVYMKLDDLFYKNFRNRDDSIYNDRLIAEPVFNEIYQDIENKILNLSLGLNNVYVSSNRFTTKRAYNFNDNTDFTNLLKQVEEPNNRTDNNCKEFISKWIKEFGIADELLLKPDLETGNFKASLRTGNKETQLADFGLGTNQLLPIIFSLSIQKFLPNSEVYGDVIIPRTVVIEEPEANLHPALQSKLSDLFVDANAKFGVQIIAETHSEYLIRRMQYLVAKNELQNKNEETISIANDKVNIHYINAQLDEEGRKAYEIKFTKNGQLTESFGKGFLDETTSLQFELYKLNNAQSN